MTRPTYADGLRRGAKICMSMMSDYPKTENAVDRALEDAEQHMLDEAKENDLAPLKIYVWQGDRVLKNYTSGMVVVAAPCAKQAWAKLKEHNFHAWFRLQTGIAHIFEESDVEWLNQDDYDAEWTVVEPVAYDVDTLPVLVIPGGE